MFPANMDVISWLGAFHVKNEVGYSRNLTHAQPMDSICSISIQQSWYKTHGCACLTECNHLQADQLLSDRHKPQPISIELLLHAVLIGLQTECE